MQLLLPSRLQTSTPGAGGYHGCALPMGRGWAKGRGRCLGCHRNTTNDNDDGHLSGGQAVNGTHSAPVPDCAGGGGKGRRSQMTGEVAASSYYTWLCLQIYRSTGFVSQASSVRLIPRYVDEEAEAQRS